MASTELITFPAGVLSADPIRLPVLGRGVGWLALFKPAGVGLAPEALETGVGNIESALVSAIGAQKPQLTALGLTYAGHVHHLDFDASGVAIFATSAQDEARMRNDWGSQRWEFVFDLLTETGRSEGEKAVTCRLPLARHPAEPRMVVSHAGGRKCETAFAPVRSFGRWACWEARTRENRPHQIRVHASESHLRISGENTYECVGSVFLSELKRKYRPGRDEERPLHPGLCLHLREVRFPGESGRTESVAAARPKSFSVLLRRLEEAGGGERQLRI